MSVFVNPNQLFPVKVRFRYLKTPEGVVTGVRIVREDAEEDDIQELECFAMGRDFHHMSKALEDSTIINHITGEPVVKASTFSPLVLLHFFRSWNLEDAQTGQPLPINIENIGRLHYRLVTALARKWLKMTGGRGGSS